MARNLVLCCDGTANGPAKDRTNVMKLWLALERGPDQIAYYDPGVGTMGSAGALTALGKKITRALDMATGNGVRQNVIEAYEFLMDFYQEGDRIYLFGFSRGRVHGAGARRAPGHVRPFAPGLAELHPVPLADVQQRRGGRAGHRRPV